MSHPKRSDTRSPAPARFAEHFRLHVTRQLERLIKQQGAFLALNLIRFEAAFSVVIRAANDRGGLHLPDLLFDDLEEWVCTGLVDEAASHEDEIKEARSTADRVGNECNQHFADLSARIAASDDWSAAFDWDYPK